MEHSNNNETNQEEVESILEEMITTYNNIRDHDSKKQILLSSLESTKPDKLIEILLERNEEDLVLFILEAYIFEEEKIYQLIFFKSIANQRMKVLEYLTRNEICNSGNIRDEQGNSGLLIAVLHSNILACKYLIKLSPSLLEVKNNVSFIYKGWYRPYKHICLQ